MTEMRTRAAFLGSCSGGVDTSRPLNPMSPALNTSGVSRRNQRIDSVRATHESQESLHGRVTQSADALPDTGFHCRH